MIELRYLVPDGTHVPPHIPRLQYRQRRDVPMSEVLIGCRPSQGDGWSEWTDVPTVTESQALEQQQ